MKKNNLPFDKLLNKMQAGIFRQTLGKKPAFCFVNAALCRLLGYTVDEMMVLSPERIFGNKRTYDLLASRVTEREVDRRKAVLRTKAGEKLLVMISLAAVPGQRGKAHYIDGIIEAEFAQQKIEKDLADSKELFKTVFNNSAAAIMVTDKDERIIAWNPFTEKMLGMGREKLFNRPVCELYPKKEWDRLRALNVRQKGVVSDIETCVLKNDGDLLAVSLSISIVKDVEGKIVGSIGIMHDVSLQKKTQKMLMDAKKVAEAASDAKTMFLANMSHEVRTPMNTILGMVDLTLDTDLNPEQRDNLMTVKNAADILLSLLNDILDLSRVEAGKIQLEDIEISVERIVRSVCKTMDILAHNKGLKLQWLIDESVPDLVKGDPVRIRQVLVNLINNAIKFTPKGKIQVEVKARSLKKKECELLFTVADEGVGIEKGKQDKIFDVFTQEDASITRQFGGTGLGLAICKKLLELMGGRIWVESEKNKGSFFYFTLPCDIVQKDEVPAALQEENIESQLMAQISKKKQEGVSEKKENVHILLAEDNLVNQKMTQRILEKKGWRVTVANNGQEVLDVMQKEKFDLILMDAQMPVMDGLAATSEIRKKEKDTSDHIPIIALTARAMEGDRKKCMDSGMDGYVSKPIDRAQLYESVQSFLIS